MKISFYINETKEKAFELYDEIIEFLKDYPCEVVSLYKDADIVIALGGDGTILRYARDHNHICKPVFGINCGTLGYLTEGTTENWKEKLKKIFSGVYTIKKRKTLIAYVYQQNSLSYTNIAVNDVYLTKNKGNILRFNLYVNDKFLNSYAADGMIVSSALGSSGYALSAGGSFIDPDSDLLELVAIAPHTLLNRSIILAGDSKVRIEVIGNNEGKVTYDGYDFNKPLVNGDYVEIENSAFDMEIVVVEEGNFIENISIMKLITMR